ncbi:STAS domain-containing protein [Salinibacterium sp. SWN1162]|uniref:STAS domain-containing protein n=1 Tax=Salinibacterium sp. SWN1162 TaxID=2792053 RepID=UPI0018CCB32D|nr:STAS domain-containing protein [Salinibacterium sp. SWN1162]MBH0009611.1 STAS domain-containing protein [Salinibacterium sp. SWN1162]
MQIHTALESNLVAVTIDGRFDIHGIEEFDRVVTERIDAAHSNVILNLAGVEFMDSSALAAMVRVLKATVALAGSVTLTEISDSARIILELTRLDAVFNTETVPTHVSARELVAA